MPNTPCNISLDTLAEALGDRTRRDIYTHISEAEHPLTASEVGEAFGVHRTVARSHLERLVNAGLLEAAAARRPGGGRPPQGYARSARRRGIQHPERHNEMLADLLLSTLRSFGEAAPIVAERVGFDYGRRLHAEASGQTAAVGEKTAAAVVETEAAEGGAPTAGAEAAESGGASAGDTGPITTAEELQERLEPLTRAGAHIKARLADGRLEIDVENCLFSELADRDPALVCTLDRGLLSGLLSDGHSRWTAISDRTGSTDHPTKPGHTHQGGRVRCEPPCRLSFVRHTWASAGTSDRPWPRAEIGSRPAPAGVNRPLS